MFAIVDQSGAVRASGASEAECLADCALRNDGVDVTTIGPVVQCASFKPEFCVGGSWATNAQRFGSFEEARASASARFMVWTMPSAYRVATSDEPITCVRIDGRDTYPQAGL